MNIRPLALAISVATLTLATACSTTSGRDDRPIYDANTPVARQVPAYAEFGRVQNISFVATPARTSGAGAVIGAVIGGVIGNQVGSGTGKTLATGAGVIGGAVAGNAIEGRNRRDDEMYRVSVRFDNGSMRDFDFSRIDELRVGDRVKFEGGQLQRL